LHPQANRGKLKQGGDKMLFEQRIKMLRIGRKMSQAQLAAQFEKSESAVRMWEAGRSKPDVDTLVSLANYFNRTTDYLLGLSDYSSMENEILAKSLPLSDAALNFVEGCSREQLRIVDGMLSAPNAENFINAFRDYIVSASRSSDEILEKNMPMIDHLNRNMNETEFLAFFDKWNWEPVLQMFADTYKDNCREWLAGETDHNASSIE
jgi:transcriptional regulator with XRE-family HTH domain